VKIQSHLAMELKKVMLRQKVSEKTSMLCCTAFVFLLSAQANGQAFSFGCTNENAAVVPTTPTEDFTLVGNGTVIHKATGLMWMQCSVGQTWTSDGCSGAANGYLWQGAMQLAEGASFAGYNDWRLPNKNELASIVEDRCSSPAINLTIFPGTEPSWYWSSSPYTDKSDFAWSVFFSNGEVSGDYKYGAGRVRLVRSGQ